jgi:ubiquitin C-terminal hydrolase
MQQRAVKQMSIRRLPPVLCLHVKRFEHMVRVFQKVQSSDELVDFAKSTHWLLACVLQRPA